MDPKKFDVYEDEFGPDTVKDDFDDEELCPECGAPPGGECEPGCPNADIEGVDPDIAYDTRFETYERADSNIEPGEGDHPQDCECQSCICANESYNFDKFMDSIIVQETKRGMPVLNDSPHRRRAIREQERPLGRTRFGGK